MEETIRYEHIRNDTIGFEMDYDYERFERRSESGRECFVLRYDNPEDPMNYLEVTYNTEDADAVSASVSEVLSNDYDIIKESFTLDRAGSCIKINASESKGGGGTPDLMQTVYIIPSGDGCLVVTSHYVIISPVLSYTEMCVCNSCRIMSISCCLRDSFSFSFVILQRSPVYLKGQGSFESLPGRNHIVSVSGCSSLCQSVPADSSDNQSYYLLRQVLKGLFCCSDVRSSH